MAHTTSIASLEAEIAHLQHLVDQCADCCKALSGADPLGFDIVLRAVGTAVPASAKVTSFTGGPDEGDLMMSFFMYWGGFYKGKLQHKKSALLRMQSEMPH